MLRQLRIKNFALIDELVFEPGEHLNIITGETGAGKSIILDALGLVLGDRAENSKGPEPSGKSIVEAHFDIAAAGLKSLFEQLELDYYDVTMLRREISPDGRSRAFVNDTPVNLGALKQLAYVLINVHSQHENLALNHPAFQLEVVDTLAGSLENAQKVRALFTEYKNIEKQLQKLEEDRRKAMDEMEFKSFQLEELLQLNVLPDEGARLEQEQQSLMHAEEIKKICAESYEVISGNEQNVSDALQTLKRNLSSFAKMNGLVNGLSERLNSVIEELKDIGAEFENLALKLQDDPERLQQINERLDGIYSMVRKHRVKDAGELAGIVEELEKFVQQGDSLEEEITKKQQLRAAIRKSLLTEVDELSAKRSKVPQSANEAATEMLRQLGMNSAVLRFEHTVVDDDSITESGRDAIRITFSANKGSEPQALSKVASGGELSRVMLVIKSLIAGKSKISSLVFDEIDTGVSGETAVKIANLLARLGNAHQVLTVTHLPQVAARGRYHYKVYKEEIGEKTFTRLKLLSEDERVEEIAKMLQGEKPGAVAFENARELMNQ